MPASRLPIVTYGTFFLAVLFLSLSGNLFGQQAVISEILAINDNINTDEDGDYSDWIEIFNPGTEVIQLNGWFLTDNPDNLDKWKFPAMDLGPGAYLLVFASGKDRAVSGEQLHTDFKLSGSGEYLALVKPDGATISFSFGSGYPVQQADVSYGLYNDQFVFMQTPTPGRANEIGDQVLHPEFSHERGFYDAAFNVELSSVNTDCDIFFTLDGSVPTPINGTKYISPVTIDRTSVLSAVAIKKSDSRSSGVVTRTYIFPRGVCTQSNTPTAYPETWGMGYPADYEMDPEICTEQNVAAIQESLKSLPTVSFVTDIDHLFSDVDDPYTGGIYIFTLETAEEWERPVSMEYFDPQQDKSFQVNCGLRLHGGNSRKPYNSPKHSFRVSFRSDYGPSELNFNLFDEKSAVNEFNSLVFRAGYNYSWVKNDPLQCEGSDLIRDPFTKKTQLDMDRTAAHSKFVHLYLNGMYWGVYNISEKITNDFAESYLCGDEDDYDVVKDHNGLVDGSLSAWEALLAVTMEGYETMEKYQAVQGNNPDGTKNPAYARLLDVRNLVDYLLINFYIGNTYWDKNNWIAARNRVTNEHGFKFLSWDAETSMNDVNENIIGLNNPGNPTGIFSPLKENEEFMMFFADRVQKHFFNDGALTPTEAEKRYTKLAGIIDTAMLAESARWGDYRRDVDPGVASYDLYSTEHWLERIEFMQDSYFPQRTEIVLGQLRDAGLFPLTDAPFISPYGGEFDDSVEVSMSASSGIIYYTTDDTDPRQPGGSVADSGAFRYTGPIEIRRNTIIKARTRLNDTWSALERVRFRISGNEAPGEFSILNPADGDTLDASQNMIFRWSRPEDTDNLVYLLHISSENLELEFSTLDTFYRIPANTLEKEEMYAAVVAASDGEYTTKTPTIRFNMEEELHVPGYSITGVEIKIYPNPVTDYLSIRVESEQSLTVRIELYDLSGRQVQSRTEKQLQGTSFLSLNLESYDPGVYLVVVRTSDSEEGEYRMEKVIKH